MKSALVLMAEIEARMACEGLGYTEQKIQDFVDMHIEGELRRDEEKTHELQRPKRNAELTKAIMNIAVDPFRKSDEFFPSYSTKQNRIMSDDQMMAANHERKRNRRET